MKRLDCVLVFTLAIAIAVPCAAKRTVPRFYLGGSGGVQILTGDVSGDIIDARGNSIGDIAVGYQLHKDWVVEFAYGFLGRFQEDSLYVALDPTDRSPDIDRVFRVQANPLFLRAYWAPGGIRDEYMKPQLSIGAGWMQVTRLLRNPPGVPPFDTSQLLPAIEVGASALFVFTRNFSGYLGARYMVTERRGIVRETNHLDSVSLVFGLRGFLPSPRDVAEPEPEPPPEPEPDRPASPDPKPDSE